MSNVTPQNVPEPARDAEDAAGSALAPDERKNPFTPGVILDGTYKIGTVRLDGGMSAVFRAEDIRSGEAQAVKTTLEASDDRRSALSFEREERALRQLAHPHIVRLIDSGQVEGNSYLVLEWLGGGNLAQRIADAGPMSWADFYESVGRPVLLALTYAQQRGWAHRDLKPQNILFTELGIAKIVDFGIARDIKQPQLNLTFAQTGSPPYTPREPDDGYQSERRDVYSWAAIAVSCLAGRVFQHGDDLQKAAEQLREFSAPQRALQRALAAASAERQEGAGVLLADMDTFHTVALASAQVRTEVFLRFEGASLQAFRKEFPAIDETDAEEFIAVDLNSCWSAYHDTVTGTLSIVGATARVTCSVGEAHMVVEQITLYTPDRAREVRDAQACVPGVIFCVGRPADWRRARDGVRAFIHRLEIMDDVLAREQEERKRSRWFDCWADFLREKERLYRSRQIGFHTRSIEEEDDCFIATIEGEFAPEQLGTSLVLQTSGGKPIIFSVEDVQADQVRLILRSGSRADIPRGAATLHTNFEAERKSIQRQRAALEDICAGRAVSPTLGEVLSSPEYAAAPEPAGLAFPEHLSKDKHRVLDKAMEVQSVLVVNGPPGTGKTTLIAELVDAYLKRYPNRRILLSSQTHVALDHVIVKLVEKGLAAAIVRIVTYGADNVRKVHKAVEQLTLDHKVHEWCVMAEQRSEEFIQEYAAVRGIDAYELKVELLGLGYVEARRSLKELREREWVLRAQESEIDERRRHKLEAGEMPDTDEILRETEETLSDRDALRTNIESAESRLNRLEESLDRLGDMGALFADADDAAVQGLLDGLVVPSVHRGTLLPLIALHLDWLNRLGSERSLHGAVLREARVVAGTCIGLGSTPAFQQDAYDLCIVDEASKATATETLVPMSRSMRCILVGDPEQLPPYFESTEEAGDPVFSDEARKSLLSVLLDSLPRANIEELVEQRRMCASIGALVSNVFYHDRLINVRDDSDRHPDTAALYPMAVTWLSTTGRKGCQEKPTASKSYENPGEVGIILAELQKLARKTRKGEKPIEVAVVAAYAGQVALLRDKVSQHMGSHPKLHIEINTVDAFQGREADVCLYSVTRSNDRKRLGFQRERKRLNVALSRARDALVIVGDASFCHGVGNPNPFRAVIDYIRSNPDFCALIQP